MSPRDPRPTEPDLWEEVEHLHPQEAGTEPSDRTWPTAPVEHVPTRPDDGPSPVSGPGPGPGLAPGAVRTGALNHPAQDADAAPDEQTRRVGDPVAGRPESDHPVAGRPAAQDPVAGNPVIDDPVAAAAWEEEPPRVPVFRWRLVGGAVMVLVVAVAAWWAVTWLMRPATPESVPVDAQSLVEAGAQERAEPEAAGEGEGEGTAKGEGPSSGREAGEDASEATEESGGSDSDGSGSGGDDDTDDSTGAGAPVARVRIHVIGEVRSPGVVTVPADARAADAIAAAGGTTRDAQAERINLAAPLIDGQQVLVPGERTTEEQLESVQAQAWAVERPAGGGADPGAGPGAGGGQAAPGVGAEDGAAAGPDGGAAGPGGGADGGVHEPGGSGQGRGDDGTVNLNSADSTTLQTLPGVGPATAEKIIAHREQVGEFQSLTDLDAVSGIGPATLERLAPLVTW